VAFNIGEIYVSLMDELKAIERALEDALHTDQALLEQASHHLLQAGGKRVRPVFVLLSGHFGSYRIDHLKPVAVAIELIHMATLVHDDVIDDADQRRGRLTVKSQWDNRVAMYAGDYILARALQVITQLKDVRVHQILAKTIMQICRGEIEQILSFNNYEQSLWQYLRRIRKKTAQLIAICCQLGAMVSGMKREWVNSLYNYGQYTGMAFQIKDDVLDFLGSNEQLGKPSGNDLRQGNITLPVIYTLAQAEYSAQLSTLLKQDLNDHMPEIIRVIERAGGFRYADMLTQRYLTKAKAALHPLPDIEVKSAFLKMADFMAQRAY
jgi:heptaprenyl diphosphate synthase